jgi:hypothetical protein
VTTTYPSRCSRDAPKEPASPPPAAQSRFAFWAGGDGFVLGKVPSEASFFNGLGMGVAGMAGDGRAGVAATVFDAVVEFDGSAPRA